MYKFSDEPYPHLSYGNQKLGRLCLSVNLPAGITCRTDAPCRKRCYALKGNFCYKSVRDCLLNNLQSYLNNPESYFNKIILELKLIPFKYFRWHSSGDIVNAEYFEGMINVAKNCPSTRFLCFTKKYEIVNNWISTNGSLPENLVVVFSCWGSFSPENPFNLPTSHVRFTKENKNDVNAFIPKNAHECQGGKTFFGRKFTCSECCNSSHNCWKLAKGESVVFDIH